MNPLRLARALRRRPVPCSLRPAIAAWRSDPDEGPAPGPPPPEGDEPAEEQAAAEAPGVDAAAPTEGVAAPPPLSPAPSHQKLMLYASAAIVVLIVIVIVALGSRPSRRALGYVPMGHASVQVVDMRRFVAGPAYRILAAADHPIARKLETIERDWNLSLTRDVAVAIDADDLTILLGRFDAARLGAEFEQAIDELDRQLGASGAVRLGVVQDDVDGREYLVAKVVSGTLPEGTAKLADRAFAAAGSSVVCFGRTRSVERFLRCHAGLRDSVLKDPHFAAAYDRRLARRTVVQRLERPGGAVTARCLQDLLGVGIEDLRAVFFALGCSEDTLDLAVRLVADGEAPARAVEASLGKPEAMDALVERLGRGNDVEVRREGSVVAITAWVKQVDFERAVVREAGAAQPSKNLLLTLLAE